jgi:hypothetical protein
LNRLHEISVDDEDRCLSTAEERLRAARDRLKTRLSKPVDEFQQCANLVERELSALEAGATLAIRVCGIRPKWLAIRNERWENLLAMLILAFPEVRWYITDLQPASLRVEEGLSEWASIEEWDGELPLFDASGLRNWVRKRTNTDLLAGNEDDAESENVETTASTNHSHRVWKWLRRYNDKQVAVIPPVAIRPEVCAAIDDETAYALFHSYIAYRFGCRSEVISDWKRMQRLFALGSSDCKGRTYWLLLEDMSLSFVDRDRSKKLSIFRRYTEVLRNGHERLQGRSEHCPALAPENDSSVYRIIITSGQSPPSQRIQKSRRKRSIGVLKDNEQFLRSYKRPRGHRWAVVTKPTEGMFGLRRKAKLPARFPGYTWPDMPSKREDEHGCPGAIAIVAEYLTRRASTNIDPDAIMDDLVRRAVLATDALELVGHSIPTLAMEALALKHRFEVMAECKFSGVAYHLDVASRLKEIRLDAKAIARSFGNRGAKNAELNARMDIINHIVHILRDHNQFDEEQVCMAKVRNLHLGLWCRRPFRQFRWALWPFLKYVNWLLASLGNLFLAVIGWIIVFGLVYSFLIGKVFPEQHPASVMASLLYASFRAATAAIIAAEPLPTYDHQIRWLKELTIAAQTCGVFHIGVLISHVYSMIARK